ncbi:MAG: hypothetical protein IJ129_03990 [Ruminococcus sp.]|nr:hypothetical protein [Ruminococcus sp.]
MKNLLRYIACLGVSVAASLAVITGYELLTHRKVGSVIRSEIEYFTESRSSDGRSFDGGFGEYEGDDQEFVYYYDSELAQAKLPFPIVYQEMFMDEEHKHTLEEIYWGIMNHEEHIGLVNELPREDVDQLMEIIVECVPAIDHIDKLFYFTLTDDDTVLGVSFTYKYDLQEDQQRKDILEQKAQEILMHLPDGSDFEKFKYIHDQIVLGCTYSDTKNSDEYTAYGCLVTGEAVCEGYGKALCMLCERAGIDCLPVLGNAMDNETGEVMPHLWNLVKLDGEWYETDVTWDDPEAGKDSDVIGYENFAITDEEMWKNHTVSPNDYMHYPACNSVECNYYIHNGWYCGADVSLWDASERALLDSLEAGDGEMRLKCGSSEMYEAATGFFTNVEDVDTYDSFFFLINNYSDLIEASGFTCDTYELSMDDSARVIRVSLMTPDE